MKPYVIVAIFLLSCFACTDEKSASQQKKAVGSKGQTTAVVEEERLVMVDKAYLGMSIYELREAYAEAEFMEEPVYEYGVDGESNGLLVKQNDESLFFVWTLEGDDKIKGITLLSDAIYLDDKVHVGMTIKAFMDQYPNASIHIDMMDERYEYIDVPELAYRPEFLTSDSTRVAAYDFEQGEPEFTGVKIPDAKIERISVY